MLFLVFFQFSPFNIYNLNLPVERFFYCLIFLYNAFNILIFLIDRLLSLFNAVFGITNFLITLKDLFVMFRL